MSMYDIISIVTAFGPRFGQIKDATKGVILTFSDTRVSELSNEGRDVSSEVAIDEIEHVTCHAIHM